LEVAQVATVRGHCPDHEDVERDDEQCPPRVVREPEEVGDDAQARRDDGDGPRPDLAREQAETGAECDEPDDDVYPAPRRGV